MPMQQKKRTGTSLKDILARAVPDELFGPVDERLRFGLRWTGALLGAGLVAVFFLRGLLWSVADFGFFRPLGEVTLVPFEILRSPVGIGVLLLTLVLWGAMAWYTDGFKQGRFEWHSVGNGLVAVGAVTAVALTLPLINFLISAVIVIVVVVLVGAVLSFA